MKCIRNKHLELLLKLIKKIVAQFYSQNSQPKRPGRPPAYPTEIIILAAILKIHKDVSYRTLELILKDKLGHSPDFSTIFYRFRFPLTEVLFVNKIVSSSVIDFNSRCAGLKRFSNASQITLR